MAQPNLSKTRGYIWPGNRIYEKTDLLREVFLLWVVSGLGSSDPNKGERNGVLRGQQIINSKL